MSGRDWFAKPIRSDRMLHDYGHTRLDRRKRPLALHVEFAALLALWLLSFGGAAAVIVLENSPQPTCQGELQ